MNQPKPSSALFKLVLNLTSSKILLKLIVNLKQALIEPSRLGFLNRLQKNFSSQVLG